jgi:hypothetical protein
MKVAQEAWSSLPPTVMAAALQAEWSLKEQLATLQSATCVVMGGPSGFSAARAGQRPLSKVGLPGLIKKTQ